MEFLWRVGYDSGNPVIGDDLDVEIAAGWTGERGVFARALEDVRLIDRLDDGRLQIHDLSENAPDYVTTRRARETERKKTKRCKHCRHTFHSSDRRSRYCSATCRKAEHRKQDGPETDKDGRVRHADRPETGRHGTPTPTRTPTRTPAPAPSIQESRESAAPAEIAVVAPAVMTFETVGTGARTWDLAASQIAAWQGAYPGLDVEAECRRAMAWISAHHERRKTATGMPRFLVGWLNRATNSGPARGSPHALVPTTTKTGRSIHAAEEAKRLLRDRHG